MERSEWLKKIRSLTEELYDRVAPLYWETYGVYDNQVHLQFVEKLLARLAEHSSILDAACGAGRYDEILLEAGHTVLGIDQSALMLERARQHFPPERYPGLRYAKIGLQEMDFQAEFDGAICMDAMENVFPEDWPGVVARFHKVLKPGGLLYFTVEVAESGEVSESYQRARAMGLPVVFGEVADQVESACEQIALMDVHQIPGELVGHACYHFYPSLEQVRLWLAQSGLFIEEEGSGNWYAHFLARKTT